MPAYILLVGRTTFGRKDRFAQRMNAPSECQRVELELDVVAVFPAKRPGAIRPSMRKFLLQRVLMLDSALLNLHNGEAAVVS